MQRARVVAGWIVLVLVGGLMLMAGAGKVFGFAPEEIVTKLRESGLGEETRLIGLGEMATGLLLILPRTAAPGVLLASSFWGGAIVFHMTRGEPYVFQSILLLMAWVGAWLRHPEVLWSFRRGRKPPVETGA
jgi:hypothetical protein